MTRPLDQPLIHVISLGAGVQSTALSLLAADGVFDVKPSHAIFADTQWEPKAVYTHLSKLEDHLRSKGIKVVRTTAGNIREDSLNKDNFLTMPVFLKDNERSHKRPRMMQRQCTLDYKVAPVRKEIRNILGIQHPQKPKPNSCSLWLGISMDEITRVKVSPKRYITHRYPLIELELDRDACAEINKEHGFLFVAKSSCIGCPFHSNKFWLEMKKKDPESFADAVEFDNEIRDREKLNATVYLHRDGVPLGDIQEDLTLGGEYDFDGECEGMCGI